MEKPCTGSDVAVQHLPDGPARTWLGITVGSSTEQDVIDELGVPESSRLWPGDQPQACVYIYKADVSALRVWLAGNVVIGLEFGLLYPHPAFGMVEVPQTFEEAKEQFGHAELVGYSRHVNGVRSVIWLSHGVQAEINLVADSLPVISILYFTPMTQEEFRNSVWSSLILDSNPSLQPGSDFRENLPKDPFDWN